MSSSESSKQDEISAKVMLSLQRAVEYWTPERVKKAVSLNDEVSNFGEVFNFDEVKSMLSDKPPVLRVTVPSAGSSHSSALGTERAAARPSPPPDLARARDHPPDSVHRGIRKSLQRFFVDNSKLPDLPYRSVGKVYAKLVKQGLHDAYVDVEVTAFYVGQPTNLKEYNEARIYRLLTVAHVFDPNKFEDAEHMIFVPASNSGLSDKMNIFHIVDKRLHSQYESGPASLNDICVLYVWPYPTSNNPPIYEALTPLKLAVKDYFGPEDGWMIIGYPSDQPKQTPLHTMLEMPSKYIPNHKVKNKCKVNLGFMTILADVVAEGGMSGGPWIYATRDEFVVNGIQSHVCHSNSVSISPHFTKELLKDLDLQVEVDLDNTG